MSGDAGAWTARAPGKLFLAGEYAVLDGGQALVAAVDRGVTCRVTPGDGLTTPGGDSRFVAAALAAVGAPAGQYDFGLWNPTDLPSKPGFGGSAAAVAAACALGLARQQAPDRPLDIDAVARVAVRVHQRVQGGGSGLDVVASVRGGLARYAGPARHELAPLPLLAVWSGRSAATGPRVQRYLAWSAAARSAFVADSDAVVGSWLADPVAALDAARRLLASQLSQAGVDYRTPGLDRIAVLARDHGGAAKPSGAGGGDVAVAVIPDPDARRAFSLACAAEGLTPIPVRIVGGVSVAQD